jgi:hypothetical protein
VKLQVFTAGETVVNTWVLKDDADAAPDIG